MFYRDLTEFIVSLLVLFLIILVKFSIKILSLSFLFWFLFKSPWYLLTIKAPDNRH